MSPGTHGILDGADVVEVLAWAAGGDAKTIVIIDGDTVRVHPARVRPIAH